MYTNCTSKYTEKREKRCQCHDNYYAQLVPTSGKSFINCNFFTDRGKKMTDKLCQFPEAFKTEDRNFVGTNFVDSPCNIAFLIKDLYHSSINPLVILKPCYE